MSHYNELNLTYGGGGGGGGGGGFAHYRGCFRLRGLLKHSVDLIFTCKSLLEI